MMYSKRKLTNKERFDIATMRYFIPSSYKVRIYPNDMKKMADLSSKGKEPKRITKGFTALKWGKTYRDEQITAYKRDISLGYFTKYEIISSFPKKLQPWIEAKLRGVPYDINQETSHMLVKMYRQRKV